MQGMKTLSLDILMQGNEADILPEVQGANVIGKCSSDGELLHALCSKRVLEINNNLFKQKNHHKTTWINLHTHSE